MGSPDEMKYSSSEPVGAPNPSHECAMSQSSSTSPDSDPQTRNSDLLNDLAINFPDISQTPSWDSMPAHQ